MCQNLPGPRCSPHTFNKLKAEEKKLESLRAKAAGKSTRALNEAIDAQALSVEVARREYYSSPAGIKELETNLAAAKEAKQKGKIEEYSWLLENAVNDRADHVLAGKIAASPTAMNPSRSKNVIAARKVENQANSILAQVTNDKAAPHVVRKANINAQEAKKARMRAERQFLLARRGIKKASLTSLKDVGSHKESYVYLKSTDFGRLGEYFPSGAYGRITETTTDSVGNVMTTIEGVKTRRLPADTMVIQKA